MQFDFSCECGKGIRILRGDLAQVTCGACGQPVPVPSAIRSALPPDFRPFAAEAAPVARPGASGGEKVFFGICWAVGLAMFAVPFFTTSETTALYRKALADPTSENIRRFTDVESHGPRYADVIKAGFEEALASKDIERLRTFLESWGGADALEDPDRRIWEFAERLGTAAAYEFYLDRYSYGAYADQARAALDRFREAETAAQERRDLATLEANPTKEAALAFLEKYPSSTSSRAVSQIVLRHLEAGWTEVEGTPSPSLLREIVEARGSNEITASLSGFTEDDTKARVFDHLKERLGALGLRVTETSSEADIRVSGSESIDRSKSYNKWGFSDSGPYAETISVSIDVYSPGSRDPAFSTSAWVTSPGTVEYTYYEVDMGPSQGDVHRATLEELMDSMKSLFGYR